MQAESETPEIQDPEAFQTLWVSAIIWYIRDAASGWTGAGVSKLSVRAMYLETVEDLLGERKQLARLCRPTDMDVDIVADAILKYLEVAEAQVAAGGGLPLLRGVEAENTGRGDQR